jgi:hypothetical protein
VGVAHEDDLARVHVHKYRSGPVSIVDLRFFQI